MVLGFNVRVRTCKLKTARITLEYTTMIELMKSVSLTLLIY